MFAGKSHRFLTKGFALLAVILIAASCSSSSSSKGENIEDVIRVEGVEPGKGVRIDATRTGEVHLFRGLANVFSTGINDLALRLQRNGIDATTHEYSAWRKVADGLIARSKRLRVSRPVALAGHSLGANSVLDMATYLGENGVKVAYVVSFDPTKPGQLGKNIDTVVNYYLTFSDNEKIAIKKPGFTGKLQNIDLTDRPGIKHVNIEKQADLQDEFVKKMLAITRKRRFDAQENLNK